MFENQPDLQIESLAKPVPSGLLSPINQAHQRFSECWYEEEDWQNLVDDTEDEA